MSLPWKDKVILVRGGAVLATQRGESPRYPVMRWQFPTGVGNSADFGEMKSCEAQRS